MTPRPTQPVRRPRPPAQAPSRRAADERAPRRAEQPRSTTRRPTTATSTTSSAVRSSAAPSEASSAATGDVTTSQGLNALYRSRVSAGSVRRFAARARRRRRPLAAAVAVLGLGVLLGWVVWLSPLLSAREVQLVGADRVTQEEVDALVAPELGRPLARLDADAVRARIEQLPEVQAVQVLRVWPSTVEVRVTERVPVAAVPAGSAFSLVDAAGVQVEQVAEPPAGLPVVSAETVAAGDDALVAAAQVLEALPDELRAQVAGTTARTPDSVTLVLASGPTVVWGSPDESDRKVAVLQVLLATPAEVYDVSAPGTPVTR